MPVGERPIEIGDSEENETSDDLENNGAFDDTLAEPIQRQALVAADTSESAGQVQKRADPDTADPPASFPWTTLIIGRLAIMLVAAIITFIVLRRRDSKTAEMHKPDVPVQSAETPVRRKSERSDGGSKSASKARVKSPEKSETRRPQQRETIAGSESLPRVRATDETS